MRSLVALLLVLLVSACSYPHTVTESKEERPTIAIEGAHRGDVLYVDGLDMGPAHQYDGQLHALIVEPGQHLIEVKNGNTVLLSEKVFLGRNQFKKFHITNRN